MPGEYFVRVQGDVGEYYFSAELDPAHLSIACFEMDASPDVDVHGNTIERGSIMAFDPISMRHSTNSYINGASDTDVYSLVTPVADATLAFSVISIGDLSLDVRALDEDGNDVLVGGFSLPGYVEGSFQSVVGQVTHISVSSTQGTMGGCSIVAFAPNMTFPNSIPVLDFETTLAADLNRDGMVNFADFLVLSANFGKQTDAVFAEGDINADGAIGFADFLLLSQEFGQTDR